MITYDRQHGNFQITDLGRIAAKYYIRHTSIEIFNEEFRPKMSEADVLAMLSMSTEVHPHHPSSLFLSFFPGTYIRCIVRPASNKGKRNPRT